MKLLLCSLGLLVAAAPRLDATELIKKALPALSREAEVIVLAKVKGTRCAWNAERRLIWTRNSLEVLEVWKGRVGRTLDVMEPGGVVHPIMHVVPAMARYRVGETVVVFLKRDVLKQWRTLGCIQGRLGVIRDGDGRLRAGSASGMGHVLSGQFPGPIGPTLRELKTRVGSLEKKKEVR